MAKRSVVQANVAGKRVLVRVDFNVPLDGDRIADDTRIRAALPTIQLLRQRGARVVLMSHLGRPKGAPDPALSLTPVAERLGELLDAPVTTTATTTGPDVEAAVAKLRDGDVLLLENLRFNTGEETNDPAFADSLARLGDLYVDDAFGAAHRAHASIVGVAERLPSFAGLLLLRETETLGRLLERPARPFVAILGGAKVSDKLGVVRRLLDRVDRLLIGGGMANTFLLAEGFEIGRSLAEAERMDDAKAMLEHSRSRGVEIVLPEDVVVAPAIAAEWGTAVAAGEVSPDQSIFDIGPRTVERYGESIVDAGTIFWNGPMGVFERPPFASGTLGIARAVAMSGAFKVVGGGDSVAAVEQAGMAEAIDHISTGGGASLELLEGRTLPGLAVLPDA
ncbi:MAG: Phosphoglycerate kinase [uncultured Thermomicrobiales bacterium]|uniref:Phosphoglycerate kinase n=1 Tax=uncultured Thermomicrobiales bacterium TaxID=1645740 RepID=A0A6J4VPD9_9BACT|nr:MAG: Phosphoglycerate kinase [uncultured Thermomicrobiales bacterium]